MTATELATETVNTETNGHRPVTPDIVQERAARLLITDVTRYTLDDVGNARRLVNSHSDRIAWVPEICTWRVWNGDRWIDDTGQGRLRSIAHLVTEDMRGEAAARAPKVARAMDLARGIARREVEARGEQLSDRQVNTAIADHQLVRDVQRAIGELRDLDGWIRTSRFHKYLNAMVTQATGVLGEDGRPIVEIGGDQWDTDLRLFNVANGTLMFGSDGAVLQDHDPSNRLTQLCPVNYNPKATALRWLAFLEWAVPDKELRLQLQVKLGLSLLGGNPQQQFIMVLGPTRSGKTTLLETVAGVLGPDYASSYDPSLLRAKREAAGRPDMVSVLNKRFIYTVEPSDGWTIDAEQIKKISGGDTIKVRDNYAKAKDFKERKPAFTAWLGANKAPLVKGADRALDERILGFPFEQYRKAEERDMHLTDTLVRDEAEGILAWLVEGYNIGQRRRELLVTPARLSVLLAQEVRKELSVPRRWVAECCETCEDHHDENCEDCKERDGKHCDSPSGYCVVHVESSKDLWNDFRRWCEDGNEAAGSRSDFGTALKDLSYLSQDPDTKKDYYVGESTNRQRARRGIRLRRPLIAATDK